MLSLRPYKADDAKTILGFCTNEMTFYMWTADRYGKYPIDAEDMNRKYLIDHGDCESEEDFYPFSVYDGDTMIGHLIMRYTDRENSVVRFGFVILNPELRGRGYGKKMILKALEHAFDDLGASKVTIGVFDNNPSAYRCYISAGFKEADVPPTPINILGNEWHYIELEYKK